MVKKLPANAEDADSIPGSRRSPGAGNGNPLQYSRLGNSMDRGVWWATVHRVSEVGHNGVTEHTHMQLLAAVLGEGATEDYDETNNHSRPQQ